MTETESPLTSVRIYDALRTAHLERLRDMAPAQMWYLVTRADYDRSLIDPSNPPVRRSRRQVIAELARRHYTAIEINEPAMVLHWPLLLPLVLTVRLRGLLTRRRTRITSYCIENADPARQVEEIWGLPPLLARVSVRVVLGVLVRLSDRLAFGTEGSLAMYRSYVGARPLRGRARLFEALPAPCPCLDLDPEVDRGGRILFLGSFIERKGIVETMAAWDALVDERRGASLLVIGAGRLSKAVESWAAERSDVEVLIDPPRDEIHRALRSSAAVVLLSQPHGAWREQIGLPILEGLAHGCEVVATSQTGLASWLTGHGHVVVEPDAPPTDVARGLSDALDRAGSRCGSLSDLPSTDQRIAADEWMLGGPD